VDADVQRVGRVSVIARARDHVAGYRASPLAPILVLERDQLPRRPSKGQMVAIGIATFLTLLLTVVGAFAMSRPICGVVPVPALAIIIAAIIAYLRSRAVVVRVDTDDVTLPGRKIPRERIESVGVGSAEPYRTLWLLVRGEGRVLVLEGLTADEAELAERSLVGALSL
jgi:hypothetical protein